MADEAPERLHALIMDFLREAGLLQPEQGLPGEQVSLSQAFALHELADGGPVSQRDLAERLRLEKSTVSRMAAQLERKGLLQREHDPADRRLYRLRLTDEGRALYGRMAAAYHAEYVRWAAEMTPAELDALLTGMSALVRVARSGAAAANSESPAVRRIEM